MNGSNDIKKKIIYTIKLEHNKKVEKYIDNINICNTNILLIVSKLYKVIYLNTVFNILLLIITLFNKKKSSYNYHN